MARAKAARKGAGDSPGLSKFSVSFNILSELYKVLGKEITAIIFFITAKTKAKKKAGAKKGGRVASELLLIKSRLLDFLDSTPFP